MLKFVMKVIFSSLLFLLLHVNAKAQDTIIMKNGERYIAKTLTIEPYKITYKLFSDQDGPTLTIRRIYVDQIILQSGTLVFSSRPTRIPQYSKAIINFDTKKNAFKWEVLSLTTNDLCFGYERHLANYFSAEIKLALIGIGNQNVENYATKNIRTSGYFIKLGGKFINPSTNNPNSNFGIYLKPEICYSQFTYDHSDYKIDYRSKYGMVNLGFMVAAIHNFGIELYAGVGIAYSQFQPFIIINSPYGYPYSIDNSRVYFYSHTSHDSVKGNSYDTVYSGGLILAFHF